MDSQKTSAMTTSHSHDHKHDHDHDHAPGTACGSAPKAASNCCGTASAAPAPRDDTLPSPAAGETLSRYRIAQMDCPTEETLIRGALKSLDGVRALAFNLMQRQLSVVHADGAGPAIVAAIKSVGMEAVPADGTAAPPPATGSAMSRWMLAGAGVLAALSEAAHFADAPIWLIAALSLAAIVACGLNTYRKGWIAVRNGELNINALMSIAVTGAVLIGQWPEAAMVMVLFNVAELIEARSLDRARNAVRQLLDLAPQTATVQQPDGTWRKVPASELSVGDRIRVQPGERIAADGQIEAGASAIDQSAITGESLPLEKTVGDAVYAATVNTYGGFEYRVTAAAGNTTLARIIHAVESAQGSRAPTQRFIDRFSRIYTPAVVAIAIAMAVIQPLFFGVAWLDALYRALSLLIIACPCALVISTPVTVVSGLTAASRRGILIKGGAYLEQGRQLRWLALDKTGTLTHGKPRQIDFAAMEGVDAEQARRIAASLAARSDHPVSKALADAADADGLTLLAVEDFAALPGRGVRGVVDGQPYVLGNRRLLAEQGLLDDALSAQLDAWEAQGRSSVAVASATRVLAVAAVADTVKESSVAAIADLHSLGIRTLMLSGDNQGAASAIAAEVGIDEARGELLPEDKLQAVTLKREQGRIGMVGDGINDAPALAAADIGFAMGAAGSGTAIETADVALMDDDLRKIGVFVRLSRATHSVLVQNIALSLGLKAIFMVLALTGYATLWMAVFADVGASLIVVANGLRLLRARVS
ncbi:Lead, cadmium, zinc and mercury transporting ATPase; Copper-translocating P-type ATPase [plant metagenome]|uniref:Lead, cadmium, zinc and mercury transporting ATPase Copper-translocating P-type ATPase n=1 Tax=plant metagenome TaxID=1297885 RepID=A0A484RE74_9ZZZZ